MFRHGSLEKIASPGAVRRFAPCPVTNPCLFLLHRSKAFAIARPSLRNGCFGGEAGALKTLAFDHSNDYLPRPQTTRTGLKREAPSQPRGVFCAVFPEVPEKKQKAQKSRLT